MIRLVSRIGSIGICIANRRYVAAGAASGMSLKIWSSASERVLCMLHENATASATASEAGGRPCRLTEVVLPYTH